jgi:hypothetical protein
MLMTVGQLKEKLRRIPDELEVAFDDLNGGRIPIETVRIERRVKFEKPGMHTETAIVVFSDDPRIEKD